MNTYLREKLSVEFVDTVTEPGPVKILGEAPESELTRSILNRVDISTGKHGSRCIALVAHTDCGGNPAPKDAQMGQLDAAVKLLKGRYPNVRVLGLWVDESWTVSEIISIEP